MRPSMMLAELITFRYRKQKQTDQLQVPNIQRCYFLLAVHPTLSKQDGKGPPVSPMLPRQPVTIWSPFALGTLSFDCYRST